MAAQRLGWGLISWCRHKVTSHWEQGERERSRKNTWWKTTLRTTHVSCPPSVWPLSENMICDVWRARKWYVQHFFFFTFRNPGKRVEMFLHKNFVWTGMGWTFILSGGDIKHVKLFFYQILCRFEPQAWTMNFKLVLEKAEEPEIKLSTSTGSLKKEENSKKHLFLVYWLCQSLWLCGSQSTVENSERDGNSRALDLPLEKPICRSGSNS